MRAWRFVGPGRLLELQEMDDPTPRPGEAVVRIAAAGLCHSDLHVMDGDWTMPIPLTLGHEGAGEVVALGSAVDGLREGDRVAVYGAQPCGRCGRCSSGQFNLCEPAEHLGLKVDGCFGELVCLRVSGLLPVPAGCEDAAVAVTTDAVLTPYHALRTIGRVGAGERLAILGLGGLGLNAVQIGAFLGARVTVVDPIAAKRDAALSLGADDALADGAELAPLGFDVVADFVGSQLSLAHAHQAVRIGGRIVLVGLAAIDATIPVVRYGAQEISLLGSFWGTRGELADCLDLVARGRLRPPYEVHPIDTVNEQIARLRAGEVLGRIVLTPTAANGHTNFGRG